MQYGSDTSPENARAVVQECVNSSVLEAKSEAKWVEMVTTAHAQVSHSAVMGFNYSMQTMYGIYVNCPYIYKLHLYLYRMYKYKSGSGGI